MFTCVGYLFSLKVIATSLEDSFSIDNSDVSWNLTKQNLYKNKFIFCLAKTRGWSELANFDVQMFVEVQGRLKRWKMWKNYEGSTKNVNLIFPCKLFLPVKHTYMAY